MSSEEFLFGGLCARLERRGAVRPRTIPQAALGERPEWMHAQDARRARAFCGRSALTARAGLGGMRVFLIALLALVAAVPAQGAIRVDSSREFHAAVEKIGNRAGTIVLERGRYGQLIVGHRARHARWLTIRGEPGATVRSLELRGARRVRITDVRIRPMGRRSGLLLLRSAEQIRVDGLDLRGVKKMARVRVRHSVDVGLRNLDLSRCRVICLRADSTAGLTLTGSLLHDCRGCDFFLARGVNGMVMRGNEFHRALPGACQAIGLRAVAARSLGPPKTGSLCNHQDLIQLVAGRDWLIEGNRFGLYQGGAAQVYLSGSAGPTDNVVIRHNRFELGDESVPGVYAANGIIVGNPPGFPGLPTRVVVENNEILSGAPRLYDPPDSPWYLMANSIVLSENYRLLPDELRPVVRGNVLGSMTHPQYCAPLAQGGTC